MNAPKLEFAVGGTIIIGKVKNEYSYREKHNLSVGLVPIECTITKVGKKYLTAKTTDPTRGGREYKIDPNEKLGQDAKGFTFHWFPSMDELNAFNLARAADAEWRKLGEFCQKEISCFTKKRPPHMSQEKIQQLQQLMSEMLQIEKEDELENDE